MEKNTYTEMDGYLYPYLILPEEKNVEVGFCGQRRKEFLKKHRKELYYTLLSGGKLNQHLADVDKQANDMFEQLVQYLAEKEGITENLKANSPMEWVQKMNNIYSRARDVIYSEIINI